MQHGVTWAGNGTEPICITFQGEVILKIAFWALQLKIPFGQVYHIGQVSPMWYIYIYIPDIYIRYKDSAQTRTYVPPPLNMQRQIREDKRGIASPNQGKECESNLVLCIIFSLQEVSQEDSLNNRNPIRAAVPLPEYYSPPVSKRSTGFDIIIRRISYSHSIYIYRIYIYIYRIYISVNVTISLALFSYCNDLTDHNHVLSLLQVVYGFSLLQFSNTIYCSIPLSIGYFIASPLSCLMAWLGALLGIATAILLGMDITRIRLELFAKSASVKIWVPFIANITIRSFGARDRLGLSVRVWLGFGLGGQSYKHRRFFDRKVILD
eukprot:sb/3466809/